MLIFTEPKIILQIELWRPMATDASAIVFVFEIKMILNCQRTLYLLLMEYLKLFMRFYHRIGPMLYAFVHYKLQMFNFNLVILFCLLVISQDNFCYSLYQVY